uniref:hypothetical protein n=1 Tax=Vibrio harveyi TaxID=669 RepID=UPI00068337DE|nr:hypothetical protein [Vibrio harveyi]
MTLAPITRDYRCSHCDHTKSYTQKAFTVFPAIKQCPVCEYFTFELHFENKETKKQYKDSQTKQAGKDLVHASNMLDKSISTERGFMNSKYYVITDIESFKGATSKLRTAGKRLAELP